MRMISSLVGLAVVSAGLLIAANRPFVKAPAPAAGSATFAGATMGTTYSVKAAGLSPAANHDHIAAELQATLDHVNRLMSTYDPNSELSRFNASGSGEWLPVTEETARVVAEAIRVGSWSGGALDVTVGPIVDLWSFGPEARPQGALPTDAEIAVAMASIDYRQLEVQLNPPALRKSSPNCRVDLSSLAKGFAVDQLATALGELGILRYMIEVGGEIRTAGLNSDGEPWQIAVERPTTAGRGIQRVIGLADCAMATSGDYLNYFEHEGVLFCHIIDPRSGRPVRHRLASVSVLAATCMEADALATALFVLGPEEGLRLAATHNIPALFLVRTNSGFSEYSTPTFAKAYP